MSVTEERRQEWVDALSGMIDRTAERRVALKDQQEELRQTPWRLRTERWHDADQKLSQAIDDLRHIDIELAAAKTRAEAL